MKIMKVDKEEFIRHFPAINVNDLIGCSCFYSPDADMGCIRDDTTYDCDLHFNKEYDFTPDDENKLLLAISFGELNAIESCRAHDQLQNYNKEEIEITEGWTKIATATSKTQPKRVYKIVTNLIINLIIFLLLVLAFIKIHEVLTMLKY